MVYRTAGSRILPYLLASSACLGSACGDDDDQASTDPLEQGSSDSSDDSAAARGKDSNADDTTGSQTDPETNDAVTDGAGMGETNADMGMNDGPMLAEPSEEAAKVLDDIADYEAWSLFAENEERMESASHAPGGMKMWVLAYRNDIVAEAETQGTLPLPDGSIIVKENYPSEDAETPMALTVMAKQDGEWFWLQSTPDGKVMVDPEGNPMAGTDVPMCLTCHEGAEDNDFVYLHDFDTATGETNADTGMDDGPMLAEPSEEAAKVLDDIADYEAWSLFAENEERMESASHAPGGMKMWVLAYRNDIVAEAETQGTLPLPDGSIIVKENYPGEDAETPMALTVMAKQDGEWFWLQSTPDGKVMVDPEGNPMAGTDVPMCLTCHEGAEDNDFVYLHDFDTALDGNLAPDAGASDAGQ